MRYKSERNNSFQILIIGKIPPPNGGVGVHVKRLLSKLGDSQFLFFFFDMRARKLISLPKYLKRSKLVHLHTSNSYFRLFTILVCRLIRTKIVFTFHGNLGRYNSLRNVLDRISIFLANHTILINKGSFKRAGGVSNRISLITAFIEPELLNLRSLDLNIEAKIHTLGLKRRYLFCTNAIGIAYDKNSQETYGIFGLIKIFSEIPDMGLIISDSSGEYTRHFADNKIDIPANVTIIDVVHDFLFIIESCDCYLRTTTTDGDSLSVREALYLNKRVIASDCVDRPEGCILYSTGNFYELKEKIKSFKFEKTSNVVTCGVPLLFDLYKKMIYG